MLFAGRDRGTGWGPRNGAGPHLGPQDRALLTPCPFPIFPVCRAYLGAGFQLATLFLLEETLRHKRSGAVPGGDTESESLRSTRPRPPPGPGAMEEGHGAQGLGVPSGCLDPGGGPESGLVCCRVGTDARCRGVCAAPAALREPGACTGPSALPKAASLLGSDLSEHNRMVPAS